MTATDSLQKTPPEGAGAPPLINPFLKVFGRAPLTLIELLTRLHQEYWPNEVIVHPADFIGLQAMLAGPEQRDEEGRAFFWIANTKILCGLPKTKLLDLTKYDGPSRVVIPRTVVKFETPSEGVQPNA